MRAEPVDGQRQGTTTRDQAEAADELGPIREELTGLLRAQRELGPQLEEELVARFLERLVPLIEREVQRRRRRIERAWLVALVGLVAGLPFLMVSAPGLFMAWTVLWAAVLVLTVVMR
jgi:hypothetical protein